jgi:Flp pilus assembly protein TadD
VAHPTVALEIKLERAIMQREWKRALYTAVMGMCFVSIAPARDLKITIPKRSHLTPVQRLNREGVEAVRKNQLEKAKALFYKAYVYDPGDPFTLNNLGYIAELEGQVERAQTFYSMVAGSPTEALIDQASTSHLKGKSLETAISAVHDVPMQVNRSNVAVVRLLSQGRTWEADQILQRTLALDPRNSFTLNNLGVAKEAEGEYTEALKYYGEAAAASTDDPVVVTLSSSWRGKSVREMASASSKRLRNRMASLQTPEAQTALFNIRGVSAMNRNDWRAAWDNFAQAYKLNPNDAFSLNNQGYLAEMNGDLETAQEFYREAQRAGGAGSRVGLATRRDAEGIRLFSVANGSEAEVSTSLEAASAARRRNPGTIRLKRRDGTPVVEPQPDSSTAPNPEQH